MAKRVVEEEEVRVARREWRRTDKVPEGFKVVPPDGGYGWVVVFGAFIVTTMLSVPTLVFGIILKDMIQFTGSTTAQASWTVSISLAVSQFVGPISTILIKQLSCRTTAMIGGVLVSAGLFFSAYADSIELLYFTFGVLTGIGMGLARAPSLVIGSHYFRVKFGVAAGIIFAGFGCGRLVFSPVCQKALDHYGFQGTFIIISGICLNTCVGAALYTPVKKFLVLQKAEPPKAPATTKPQSTTTTKKQEAPKTKPINQRDSTKAENQYVTKSEATKAENQYVTKRELTKPGDQYTTKRDATKPENQYVTKIEATKPEDQYVTKRDATKPGDQVWIPMKDMANPEERAPFLDYDRQDRYNGDKIANYLVSAGSVESIHQVVNVPPEKKPLPAIAPIPLSRWASFKKQLLDSLDFSLLKNPVFYLICFSGVLSYLTILYSNVFLFPLGIDRGLTPFEASMVVTAKAAAEIVGRLGFPWLQQLLPIDPILFLIVICLLVGFSLLAQSLVLSFPAFIAMAIITGALSGGTVVQNTNVTLLIMGAPKYASVIGLCSFIQSFFALVAGPFIGFIRDVTGSFVQCYLFITGVQFFSALLWIVRFIYTSCCLPK